MEPPLISVENLEVHFESSRRVFVSEPAVRAVDDVSLQIHPGETVGIVGESGSGKSTLAKAILDVLEPTGGFVSHRGRPIRELRGERKREYKRGVQAVFQDPWASLNPRMRVVPLIAEPLAANGVGTREDRKRRAVDLLASVGLHESVGNSYPHQLSGGQRQRVAIARSLALEPDLIVLDEPVSSLDVSVAAQIMNLLLDLQTERGLAYLLIAHDFGVIRHLADQVHVMYLGEVVESGNVGEVFDEAIRGRAHPYTQTLLAASMEVEERAQASHLIVGGEIPSSTAPPSGCRFHTRCPHRVDICSSRRPPMIARSRDQELACHLFDDEHSTEFELMARVVTEAFAAGGGRVTRAPTEQTSSSAPALLEVRGLVTEALTSRGAGYPVDGVDLKLRSGETVGLVGESGSGKSLTARSIVRVLPRGVRLVGGQVIFDGQDLTVMDDDRIRREVRGHRIAMILQDPLGSLNPVKRIGTLLESVIDLHRNLSRSERVMLAKDLLERVRIPDVETQMDSYPHQLSGGQRQRVVSAMALSGSPEILIADEPTTSLDPTIQAHFLDLLRTLQEEERLAILFITHDLGIVANLCDRVAVMYAGRVVEEGPVEQILRHPVHPYTSGLIESVPRLHTTEARLRTIPGQPPSVLDRPNGCPFAPRCAYVMDHCRETYPPTLEAGPAGHKAACWLLEEVHDPVTRGPQT